MVYKEDDDVNQVDAIIGVVYKEDAPVMDQGGMGNWTSVWRRNDPPEENWTTANCVRQTYISTTFTTFTKKLKYTSPYSTNILLTTALIALDIWILLTRCKLKFTCGNLETLNIFEKNYI